MSLIIVPYKTILTNNVQKYIRYSCHKFFRNLFFIDKFLNYLENWPWVKTNPSNLIGNLTSQLPTMFWILKSRNFAWRDISYFKNINCVHMEITDISNAYFFFSPYLSIKYKQLIPNKSIMVFKKIQVKDYFLLTEFKTIQPMLALKS